MEILFNAKKSIKYHTCLSNYFFTQFLFIDGDLKKKPHIRKCIELPFQQTKAEMWDEVTDTLCDLEFIQAKAVAKMTYDLIRDFNDVLEVIPDNAENISKEKARQERMNKYTNDLIAYAKGEIFKLEIPESITPWPQGKIDTEINRMKTNPTRADRLKDFLNFLGKEAGNLQNYAFEFSHFATQQAWNYSAEGPVGKAVEKAPSEVSKSLLRRIPPTRPYWNPLPQVLRILRVHTDSVSAIFITSDGQRAISGSHDNTCIFWDLGTGQVLQTLRGHTSYVAAISITPDGQRAISCSYDRTCILWDMVTSQMLQILRGHTHSVLTISITPDGQRAISGSDDNTCILWDLGTRRKLACFTSSSSISSVRICSNVILIGCLSGEVVIVKIDKNFLCPGAAITTTRKIWDFELQQYLPLSADCPICGYRFSPPVSVLATIEEITKKAGLKPEQSPCLEFPDEAWEDPGLLGNCPKCGGELKFNPFIAGGDN